MSINLLNNIDSDPCVDYRGMRALVVDDYPGMRSAFKNTLANFGMTKIDLASAAAEAIYRVKHSNYDIIVCDYNLGEGRDGQQLLEELRHRQLIGLETVFVMVTAESLYEKVVSTAELAPDDYLIKPFNAEVLRNRLDVILQRKLAFSDIYRLFGKGDLEACMAACDELMRERPKYVVDALRFKGELLNAMGRFEEAEVLYKKILEMRAVPWARLGLARALHLQDQQDEAEELLQEIIDERPEMVAAYDLLCDVRLSKKDSRGAQEALQMGTAISAKTVRRQQKLGEVAYRNGDLDTAKKALSTASRRAAIPSSSPPRTMPTCAGSSSNRATWRLPPTPSRTARPCCRRRRRDSSPPP
ncbi:MAG: response regulator [Thiobacillaceae bacterium]